MKDKIILLFMTVCLIIAMPLNVTGTENFTYSVVANTTTPTIGSQVEVVISLTNYGTLTSEIRGLQIDVTNIDTSVLEVVSHESLLTDSTAASNKTSYQSAKNLVRYVYLNLSGSMDKAVTDVMKFTLKINDTLTDDGTITLPITIKIGTMSENITLEDSLVINYKTGSSNTVSVDVAWGNMEFMYDDGTWDTENHKWVDSGWQPISSDSNLITVSNNGNDDVKIKLSFSSNTGYEGFEGKFTDENESEITSAVSISATEREKVWFNVSGSAGTRWSDEYANIGKLTLTLIE